MAQQSSSLVREFLTWVAAEPRSYAQAMEAWRSTCPRQTVWEDAQIDGLIRVEGDGTMQRAGVVLTPRGRALLAQGDSQMPPTIHQEVTFDAAPSRVYQALTDAGEFAKFTGAPARIEPDEGGAFVCFGTFVLGRNVELVKDKRIVQAWRVFNWPEGVFSIVRFELSAEGGKTRLVMEQSGVPDDAVKHVDGGWGHKYWEPLKHYLNE